MNIPPISPKPDSSLFQRVKAIMEQPIRPPEPYTDTEIEALMWQTPLPETDLPNNGMQLPAEEQNDPNQLELTI